MLDKRMRNVDPLDQSSDSCHGGKRKDKHLALLKKERIAFGMRRWNLKLGCFLVRPVGIK